MSNSHMAIHALAIGLGLGLLACGPAPGSRPVQVPANAIRVVPASQVKGTCVCDDDEYDLDAVPAPRKAVEYVKMDEWSTPPAVRDFEANHVPKAGGSTEFPKLTLHRPIGDTSVWGTFRARGYYFHH